VAALWCGSSLVPTRRLQATSTELSWVRALWVATDAEERKKSKCSSLSPLYDFTPIAVEMNFFRQLGRRIQTTTAETSSFAFFMQRLSVVIQRGNAVCIKCWDCTVIWQLEHGHLIYCFSCFVCLFGFSFVTK